MLREGNKQTCHLQPGMTETLVHTISLPHLDLQKIVDQICGCDENRYDDSYVVNLQDNLFHTNSFFKHNSQGGDYKYMKMCRNKKMTGSLNLNIPLYCAYVGRAAAWTVEEN